MSRVLLLGLLAAMLVSGAQAWAEDEDPGPAAPKEEIPASPRVTPAAPAPEASSPGGPSAADPYAPPPPTLAGSRPGSGGRGTGWTPPPCSPTPPAGGADVLPEGMVLRALRPGMTETHARPWTGAINLRYRLRTTDDEDSAYETDQDVFAYVRVNYRDEELPGLSGSFHGRLSVDVDDFSNVRGYNAFDSVTDTYDSRWNPRIYHAYLHYTMCNCPLRSARLGRQWLDVGEYVTFDGARVESARTPWGCIGVAAFAGMPTYLFDEAFTGDFMGGIQLFGQPWDGAEWRFDWTYVDSENVYGSIHDNLFNLVWNQRLGRSSTARLEYQHLDEDPRRFRAVVDAVWPSCDLVVRGHVNTLINAQLERVYDFDYYYWTELALEPYWQAHVSVSKGIWECLDADAGVSIRRLYDTADEGTYNREWEQYFAGLSTYDWLVPGLALTLTGEWWNSTDDFGTVVFDVEYRPSRVWRFVVGTDYAAYSYDLYADQERVDVYSVFGRISWRPSPCWLFDLRLRVENDDYGTYTRLDALAQFSF